MEKGFLGILIFLFGNLLFASETKPQPLQLGIVYTVYDTQSLWKFSIHLGVDKNRISRFISELMSENPHIPNPNLIHPEDKITISEALFKKYVDPQNHYSIRQLEPPASPAETPEIRTPASASALTLEKESTGGYFVQPHFGFSRIDSKQRNQSSTATLYSSKNLGLYLGYNWKNNLGQMGFGIDFDWTEYNENIGQGIERNSLLSTSVDVEQNFQLSSSTYALLAIGFYQSPYIFTDSRNQLVLKQAHQPGVRFGLAKLIASLDTEFSITGRYLYQSLAGDTPIEDGLGYKVQVSYLFTVFGQKAPLSLWWQQDFLLSEVTEQERSMIGASFGYQF